MITKPEFSIPEPTLKRLPRYYNYLKGLLNKGREVVSCTHIGKDLDLDPPQIRKDLAYTGIRGIPKVGYQVEVLLNSIEEFFGWNSCDEAFLVGAGNIGRALINYQGFQRYGFRIVAAFDNSPEIVGKRIDKIEVLPLAKLTNLCLRMNVKIGVITTPDHAAQEVADMMIAGGIKGIWNFAPAEIKTPEGVIVQSENLAAGLSMLSKKLQMLQKSGKIRQEDTK
ncbi:MAG: redox-sensing transcriptional repressor Rex [Candidatus Riflebacteria bacterium]|nr:redox-sensing transcriptional repressor Rex [Candidatus Riflebacteria bacterium]